MGCGDSKGLTAKEITINNSDNHEKRVQSVQNKITPQNLSKNAESKVEEKKLKKNTIILTENNNSKNDINKVHENNEHKDKINLIYFSNFNSLMILFGKEFVKNNIDNIDLIINGKESKLVDRCISNKGNNIITMIIKNQLTDLS